MITYGFKLFKWNLESFAYNNNKISFSQVQRNQNYFNTL